MKRFKGVKKALILALGLGSLATLTGCGNYKMFDMEYELNYVIIEENGKDVLHKIDKWTDSESESVCFSTDCCDNYIWTSANKAVMYKEKPKSSAYDEECEMGNE